MKPEESLINFAGPIVQRAIAAVITASIEQRSKSRPKKQKTENLAAEVERALQAVDESVFAMHVQETYRWAAEIHVQGMAEPVETGSASVGLAFAPVARRFRMSTDESLSLDEAALTATQQSFLLLGDPGSGKTTTLKRLALTIYTLAADVGAVPAIPVVIVCRQIDWEKTSIAAEILRAFGVDPGSLRSNLALSETLFLQFAAKVLDQTSALVLVDGLDEIPDQEHRATVLLHLERLRIMMNSARVICSCRSGDAPHAQGFSTAELLPLTEEQIAAIAERRTGDAKAFMDRVKDAGIRRDILDRPLFLSQVLMVYETSGMLPERPVDLYRHLLRLLLHDWDEQRRVARHSRYAEFDSETKKEFLSEIAFRLTVQGLVTFDENDLMHVYRDIYQQYNLPHNQARRVVREIESHTGIVAEASTGFQFTHYTMQEYLCADNISRRPITKEVAAYVRSYPEVIAVAIALSSQPTQWLNECLKLTSVRGLTNPFVSRLGLERPRFVADDDLGNAIIRLMSTADATDAPHWERLSKLPSVRRAMELLPARFDIEEDGSLLLLKRYRQGGRGEAVKGSFAKVPAAIYDMFVNHRA